MSARPRSHRLKTALVCAVACAVPGIAPSARAQSIFDSGLRGGPQYVVYRVDAPVDTKISELVVPIFVVVPVTHALTFDIGTAYANARVEPIGGATAATSTLSGFTDTQIRANYALGTDFVVLTAGVNIPTGRETATADEAAAAFLIGNDYLAFPISNFGTGFGFTGGVAIARPLGSWNLGFGGSLRHSASYEPFDDGAGTRPRFAPGNEYRARVGLDHPFAAGRVAFGVTYSTFGNDDLGGSIYNTGNRLIAQAGLTNTIDGATLVVDAWNLFRGAGTVFGGTATGRENIANLLIGVGVPVAGGTLSPSVEGRRWSQEGRQSSSLGTLGLRYTVGSGAFTVTPSAGYSMGTFTSTNRVDLRGYRAALSIRVGP